MEIHNSRNLPFSFPDNLLPLFEAMQLGKKIKSVTCYAGEVHKNDRSKDFVMRDFVAEEYWVAMQTSGVTDETFDLVHTSEKTVNRGSFYIGWVISFELYQ